MDVQARVREELESGAAKIDVRDRAPEMVEATSSRRRRRGRRNAAVVALLTAAVVTVTSVALVTRGKKSARHRSVSIAVSTTEKPNKPPAGPAPRLQFAWNGVEGIPPMEGSKYFTSTSGVTYAMQQALAPIPGQWFELTTDGHWRQRHLDFGRPLLDFAGYGNTLYALLAPRNDGSSDYALAQSTDGGKNWVRSKLPIAFSPPSTKVAWSWTKTDAEFAVNGQGLVVVGRMLFQAQPVTDALRTWRDARAQVVASGIDIIRCTAQLADGCVEAIPRHFNWSDLGVTSARDMYAQGVWVSADATHWRRAETGLNPTDAWADAIEPGLDLSALRDRVIMATHPYHDFSVEGDDTPTYYELLDGTWRVAPFGHTSWIGFGDATTDMVMIAPQPTVPAGPCSLGVCAFRTSTDAGSTWHTTSIPGIVPHASTVRLFAPFATPIGGGVGFTAHVSTARNGDVSDYLIASRDGMRWTVVSATTAGLDGWFDAQVHAGAGRLWVSFRDSRHGFKNSAIVGAVTR